MEPALIPIDVGQPVPEEQLIPIDTGTSSPQILPQSVLAGRAAKASFGLDKPYDYVEAALSSGNEAAFRGEAAAERDVETNRKVNDAVFAVAKGKEGPLTAEDVGAITNHVTKGESFTHPRSVIEREFSEKYFGALYNKSNEDGNWFSTYLKNNPRDEDQISYLGKEYASQRQIILTQLENATAAAENQSWPGFLTDIAKNLATFGIYGEVKERNLIPGVGVINLLGTNKEEQRQRLFQMGLPEFTDTVTKVSDKLINDNPHLAVEWLNAMLGNFDKDVDNLMSGVTIATVPGTGTAAKLIRRGGAAVASKLFAKEPNTMQAVKAVTDMVKGAETPGQSIKVSQNVAAGDLKEAAVQKVTEDVASQLRGTANPPRIAVDALYDGYKALADNIRSNPGEGPGAQELANRIALGVEQSAVNLKQLTQNVLRTDRTPEAVTPNAIRIQSDLIRDNYKGIDSAVLDVKLHTHAETNTRHWETQIGRTDATLFGSRDEAAAAATINNITLKGTADAARQFELQRLLKATEFDLDSARRVQALSKRAGDAAAEQRFNLGISKQTKRPDFDEHIKTLENNHAKYTEELARLRNLPGATIEQQGVGFYISKHDPFVEIGKPARSFLGTTPETQKTTGYFRSMIGFLRSGAETGTRDNLTQANVALLTVSQLEALAKAELADVTKLTRWAGKGTKKKQWVADLNDTIRSTRTNGLFENISDLKAYYLQHYDRVISEKEIAAYFGIVKYGKLQEVLDSLGRYTQESRVGAKMHSIQTRDAQGRPTSSGFFKAAPADLTKVSTGEGVLYIPAGVDTALIKTVSGIKNTKGVMEAVQEGRLKFLEVLYPNEKPLKNFANVGNNHVQYVLVPATSETPLQFTRTGRKDGGLHDLNYSFSVSQPIIEHDVKSNTYRHKGQTAALVINNRALGADVTKNLNKARDLLREGKVAEAQAEVGKTSIPWEDFKGWTEPRTMPDGTVVPPKISLDARVPFKLVPRGSQIVHMDKELQTQFGTRFRDDTRSRIIGRQYELDTVGDPYEMHTIVDKGSLKNPLHSYEPAEYLDPVPSLNRSLRRIADSSFMADYKHYAVEHWIADAKKLKALDAKEEQLDKNPVYYFYHGKIAQGTKKDIKARLEDSRAKANNIWGQPSWYDTQVHDMANQMYDMIYKNAGPSVLKPFWKIGNKLDDIAGDLKSLTFHTTMGLFTPVQFVVQNMTWATIAGIEGIGHAASGAAATMFHAWAHVSPQSIKAIDKFMTMLPVPTIEGAIRGQGALVRWRPGDFTEAHDILMNRTGLNLIGSEHSLVDGAYAARMIGTGKDAVLDLGATGFKLGEKSVRIGAWYTAYRKWKDLHPTEIPTDKDVRDIVSRTIMLSGDMTKAAKSNLERGPLSFATQFLSYNLRTAELVTGKRLTPLERTRLLATYWGAFGLAGAGGLAVLPVGDMARKLAVDWGYTHDPGQVSTFLMEGLPAAGIQWATGELYGIGQRYGSTGLDPLREILSGDKSMWQLATGATGNFLSNSWAATSYFRAAMMSIAKNDDEHFPLKANDFLEPLKNVSSVNSLVRLSHALNTTEWLDRKGRKLDENIGPLNAILMTLTGVQPQRVYDRQSQISLTKDRRHDMEQTEELFLAEAGRFAQATKDQDWEQSADYGKRMRALLIQRGYPEDRWGALFARAEKAHETLINQGDMQLYMRNVPNKNKKQNLENLQRLRQQNRPDIQGQ